MKLLLTLKNLHIYRVIMFFSFLQHIIKAGNGINLKRFSSQVNPTQIFKLLEGFQKFFPKLQELCFQCDHLVFLSSKKLISCRAYLFVRFVHHLHQHKSFLSVNFCSTLYIEYKTEATMKYLINWLIFSTYYYLCLNFFFQKVVHTFHIIS